MNFMNLPDEYTKDAYFHIVTIPYEKDTTFGKGASKGPVAIIKASEHLEYYDEQFDKEPFLEHIDVIETTPGKTPKEMIASTKATYPKEGFTITLGGDHATSIGTIGAIEDDFDVVIFDAHSDLRDSWNNSQLNHACIAKRVSKDHSVGIIGVRSQDKDEVENQPENVHVLRCYDFQSLEDLDKILSQLKKKIFISIDVDVFDPSFIRKTGTPEPGGFNWDRLIESLAYVFKEKEVIGADIVEYCGGDDAESYALAKLAHKLMALHLLNKE